MLAVKYKWMLRLHLKQSSIPILSVCQGNANMKEESLTLQWPATAAVCIFFHTWTTSHPPRNGSTANDPNMPHARCGADRCEG